MRPHNLDLNQVRTFATLADVGTVTGTAEQLAYTQSAVSMQLRRLEQALGTELVRKQGRRVALTTDGERFLAHARRLLGLNDEARADMRSKPVTGVVQLAVPDDYAALLTPTLAYFGQLYPGVQLEVHCGLSVDLVERVRSGDADLAIVTRQRNSPGGEVLRREPLVWAASHRHEPEARDPIPLALFSPGKDVFREMALHALTSAGRQWRIVCTSQGLTGVRPAVDAGLAATVITHGMLPSDFRVLGPDSGLPALPSVEIAIHRPPGRPSEPVRQLATLIHDQLAQG